MLGASRVIVLIGSLCLVAVGLVAGAIGLVVALLSPPEAMLSTATVAASFTALSVGLGLALAWHAWRATQGRASAPFAPRHTWIWIVVYLLVIGVGQAILSARILPELLFPPFHVAASALPAWIALSGVARGLGPVSTWRDIVLEIGSGAFLSTTLAIFFESILLVGLLIAVIGGVAMQPDGIELLQSWLERLQDPGWLQDPSALSLLVRSPLVAATVLLIVAGLVPLMEEATKTVGVGLRAYRRPALSQAFLWGVACGAGFAIAEGLFNAAGGLQSWGLVVTLRVGATVLHCLTGGLMGIAWYWILAERRWGRAAALYGASVGIHGLWNALSIGVLMLSLGSVDSISGSEGGTLAGTGSLVALALLSSLAVAMCLALWGVTRAVRRRSPLAAPPEPPALSSDPVVPDHAPPASHGE
jgi:hypothetical protein